MDFDKITANIDAISEATAKAAGVTNSHIVRDTVRDTITALQANIIKEFGGLEKHAAEAIRAFDAGGQAEEAAPVEVVKEAPKAKTKK